jgi:hypothetical protein
VNVELILCNQRVSKKMCVRYVMIDPEFLIIIEPDFSVQNENRIIIHQKVPLVHVQSMIDRQDQRNLVIAFAMFYAQNSGAPSDGASTDSRGQGPQPGGQNQINSGGQQFSHKEVLLYFENTSKCNYVKNMLDHTKKTFKQQQVNKVNHFLDKSLRLYGLS